MKERRFLNFPLLLTIMQRLPSSIPIYIVQINSEARESDLCEFNTDLILGEMRPF